MDKKKRITDLVSLYTNQLHENRHSAGGGIDVDMVTKELVLVNDLFELLPKISSEEKEPVAEPTNKYPYEGNKIKFESLGAGIVEVNCGNKLAYRFHVKELFSPNESFFKKFVIPRLAESNWAIEPSKFDGQRNEVHFRIKKGDIKVVAFDRLPRNSTLCQYGMPLDQFIHQNREFLYEIIKRMPPECPKSNPSEKGMMINEGEYQRGTTQPRSFYSPDPSPEDKKEPKPKKLELKMSYIKKIEKRFTNKSTLSGSTDYDYLLFPHYQDIVDNNPIIVGCDEVVRTPMVGQRIDYWDSEGIVYILYIDGDKIYDTRQVRDIRKEPDNTVNSRLERLERLERILEANGIYE